MHTIRPIRSSFTNGLLILITFVVLIEIVSWTNSYEIRLSYLDQNGGVLPYIGLLVRRLLLPEIMSVFIITLLINWFQRWFKIELVDMTWSSVVRYQLSFLPILLVAFAIFTPFTQSVRYLIDAFPNYSFADYWFKYIIATYSWIVYFRYLFFVLFIGYCTLNISLLTSILRNDGPSTL